MAEIFSEVEMIKSFYSKPIFKFFLYLFLALFFSGIFVSIGVKAKTKEYLEILEHSFSPFSPNGDGSKDIGIFNAKVKLIKEKGPKRIRWELKVFNSDGKEVLYREKDMEIVEGEGTFIIDIQDSNIF